MITTRITANGLRTLETLEAPIADLHARQFGHFKAAQPPHADRALGAGPK